MDAFYPGLAAQGQIIQLFYAQRQKYAITGKVYSAANPAMVNAYREIGERIYKACGENDRAQYGKTRKKERSPDKAGDRSFCAVQFMPRRA